MVKREGPMEANDASTRSRFTCRTLRMLSPSSSESLRRACEAKAGETDRLRRKVEQEMKQKASDALDEVL